MENNTLYLYDDLNNFLNRTDNEHKVTIIIDNNTMWAAKYKKLYA